MRHIVHETYRATARLTYQRSNIDSQNQHPKGTPLRLGQLFGTLALWLQLFFALHVLLATVEQMVVVVRQKVVIALQFGHAQKQE